MSLAARRRSQALLAARPHLAAQPGHRSADRTILTHALERASARVRAGDFLAK
jgi:hypothetical protein